MRKLLALLAIVSTLLLGGCNSHSDYRMVDGTIVYNTPERAAGQQDMLGFAAEPIKTVRVGFIGLGMRGPGAVRRWCSIEGTEIVALCDINPEGIAKSQKYIADAGRKPAAEYCGSEDAWRQLCEREDIDLVYIMTDWKSHAPMALYAMECGKHVAIEVPAAISMAEIWALIETSERTRKHCIQLENCVYDRFEMTALNMAQQGLFGEILHVEGAYIHCLSEFWDRYYNNWRLDFNREHAGDVYPTHGIGPICQVLNIHRGDRMKSLVAMSTKAVSGAKYWQKLFGEPCSEFANGDQTTTLISTERGKVIQLHHNVMTPRPYSRDYALVGTTGYASKYPVQSFLLGEHTVGDVDIENLNSHRCVSDDVRKQLMERYKHPVTAHTEAMAAKVGGHGGMDYIMDYRLVYCLQNGLPLDMDVYDLAEWCCPIELSAVSIKHGSAPVAVPDFTRGGWDRIDGYRHAWMK
ncbi:MAG: Gfo/Idh/MocA family oxidoreductase [Alistipes sp.]|nr:Gfo/Idh/MocA family oxidoreductase [Alistipes sp.]